MRRTALRRSTKRMRRTPLRKVSKKQSGRLSIYYDIRDLWMKIPLNQTCWICRKAPATDVHHMKSRRGNLLFDTRWWMALCRADHERVHQNVAWAKSKGYLLPWWK